MSDIDRTYSKVDENRFLDITSRFTEVSDLFISRPAIFLDQTSFTYGEIRVFVDMLAAQLAHLRVRRGNRVLLWGRESPMLIIARLSILKLGASIMRLKGDESAAQVQEVMRSLKPRLALYSGALNAPSPDVFGRALRVFDSAVLLRKPAREAITAPRIPPSDTAFIFSCESDSGVGYFCFPQSAVMFSFAGSGNPLLVKPGEVVLLDPSLPENMILVQIFCTLLQGATLRLATAVTGGGRGTVRTGHANVLVLDSDALLKTLSHQPDLFQRAQILHIVGKLPFPPVINRILRISQNLQIFHNQLQGIYLGPFANAIITPDCSDLNALGYRPVPGVRINSGSVAGQKHAIDRIRLTGPGCALDLGTGSVTEALPQSGIKFAQRLNNGAYRMPTSTPKEGVAQAQYLGPLSQIDGVAEGHLVGVNAGQGAYRLCVLLCGQADDTARPALEGQLRAALGDETCAIDIIALPEMPRLSDGTPDQAALCRIAQERTPDPAQPDAAQLRTIKDQIVAVWAEVLGSSAPPRNADTFFGLGGTSLQLMTVQRKLSDRLGLAIAVTTMLEAPRLNDLARILAREIGDRPDTHLRPRAMPADAPEPAPGTPPDGAVAIVAMAGRIPGAPDLGAFWDAICTGRNLIRRFEPDELEDGFTDAERAAPNYVPVRPILEGAEQFDAKYFGMLPREASVMDPQHRVFLEICHEALERAGYDPLATPGRVGVYAGQAANTYAMNNVFADRERVEDFTSNFQVGNYAELTGSWVDSLATRVSFKLDLKGPALTVQTACSTSLTAIAQACEALAAGSCDMALAGGVSITFPQRRGYMALEGGMVSADGVCRPFDAAANGTVFGHGAGVVLLKPLRAAMRDNDQIIAVIRGVGVNNDGADKIAYTAPSVMGQAGAIAAAHRAAGLVAGDISYLECHGTATPLGDPVELTGLAQVFGPDLARGSVAVGSVKGNIGHLDAAAGVVGVIKTALMLQHAKIPPVANFRTENPKFDFAASPFHVPRQMQDWQPEAADGTSRALRRAGVSSFGVGGTNVHVVLEEAPLRAPASVDDGPHILPISARTPEALEVMRARMADFLERKAPDLGDLSHTLQQGRHAHPCRSAIACTDRADAVATLRKPGAPRIAPEDTPPLVFMFPGQGSQYPGMGSGLYASEPVFREWIDRGAALLEPLLDLNINDLLCYAQTSDAAAARALRETRLTQPALYLVQVATAQLWLSRGIRPTAMIGHSVGEFAAATLAGVMSFETGLKIIAARGRLMQDQPGGAMLSVRADRAALDAVLDDSVDLAASNAPRLHVLAGSHEAIVAMQARLEKAGLPASLLHTSHAFHSRMMDPVTDPLRREMQGMALQDPQIPYVSCVTGTWITKDEARDPAYWAAQARATVNFEAGIQTVCEGQGTVMLEVGAGSTLSAFAGQTLKRGGHGGIFSSLPDHTRPVPDAVAMAHSASQLWTSGFPLDWSRWRKGSGRRIAAPTYPFERRPYWIEAPAPLRRAGLLAAATGTVQPITQGILPMPNDMTAAVTPPAADRKPSLVAELCALLSDLSGEELGPQEAPLSFLELGFDSLFLGQVSQSLGKTYSVQITFRQLLSDIPSIDALAAHLDGVLPPETAPAAQALPTATPVASAPVAAMPAPAAATPAVQMTAGAPAQASPGMEGVVQAQLSVMQSLFAEQLRALSGGQPQVAAVPSPAPAPVAAPTAAPPAPAVMTPTPEDEPVRYAIGRGMAVSGAVLDDRQRAFARDLADRYARRHTGSKARTDRYRTALADPRTAAGFREEWKEMVFPIVAERAKGARIWDIDGNEFVDIVSGFGQTAFGHAPDFVLDALRNQMERGFAIGPQSDLAGSVAEHFARFTGHERVTFCNTGSEAVMAAMRVARTVTGRDRIVVFANDYHGQFDEVLVKGRSRGASPSALPIAPGIPRSGLSNMVVLPYGGAEALDWIRANLDDIAAFVVEPVQSRHPEHRPVEFVRALRELAYQSGAALVFDEVVTGFRVHKRGMQGLWGIRADLATYGKIVGGGMPIGVLAGDGRFMNALDGGPWRYGDASKPETPPTFFAGTFVRHPLVLAAVAATLDHMEAHGDQLWTGVAERTQALLERFDTIFDSRGMPRLISGFSSWYAFNLVQHNPTAALAYPMLRLAGVHVQEGYCGFMTTAHSDADFARIGATMETVVDQLQEIGVLDGTRAEPASAPPAPAPQDTAIPLSPAQREIWMIAQLGDLASTSFNEGMVIDLAGDLDIAALGRSLNAVAARHDALRLLFARNGDSFEVAEPYEVALPCHDLRSEVDPDAALAALLDTEARTPFDLVDGPPFRAALVQRGDAEFTLVLNAHHIVCDGWSYNVLIADLARLYTAEVRGQPADLPAAPSFATHALQHAQTQMDPVVEGYWRAQYHSLPELPELPTDRARPNRRSFRGATCSRLISAEQMKRFRKAGARQGCTLFSTLFAGLHMLLSRLSGAQDFAIGVPTGGQALLENPALIGHCVHFLPIRAQVDPDAPAGVHLRQIRDQVLGAFDHQATTYGALVDALKIERSLSRLPLTEVQFNLEKVGEGARLEGLDMTVAPNAKAGVNFDLFFNMIESDEGLRVDVDYNSDLFDGDTINRWIGHLETLLGAVADDADTPVKALPLLNAAEAEALEARCNATAAPLPDLPLADLLREGARLQPDALAFEAEDGRLTHAEFDARSNALAAQIQAILPEPGARVAVALERSTTMVLALVAVLKAGHAYIPLDPRQPDQRLGLILQGAQAAAIITPDGAVPAYAEGMEIQALSPDITDAKARPVNHPTDPEAAAYVIFTSGSTGTPKGVEITQRAAVNFLSSMAQAPGFTAQDRILAVTTVSFDIAVLELLLPLATGGGAVIARSDDVLDPFRLVDRIGQGDITVLQATPTLWQMLLEAGFTPSPQVKMLAGGEPLPADLATRLAAGGGELWNMYGPTETTVWSAAYRIAPDEDRITIGYPIANTQLHVLDAEDALLPPGLIGELNIGGAGLALGYFQRPDLTEAAFRLVALPSGPQMLYKTGDMARRLADGRIAVLGRRDNQIKLRGFRIELGDVETAMRGLSGVQKAAAAVQRGHDGAMQLVGYVVPEPGATLAAPDMMQALQTRLPAYMVPTAWVTLDAMPQTMNGKLDRKALPAPSMASMAAPVQGTTAPATDLERQIAAIWQEVLGLESISTTDTLFALGADSLKVFRIAARLLDADLNLDARDLLEHPSVRELAAFAASGQRNRGGAKARPSLRDFRNGARRAAMRAGATAAQ